MTNTRLPPKDDLSLSSFGDVETLSDEGESRQIRGEQRKLGGFRGARGRGRRKLGGFRGARGRGRRKFGASTGEWREKFVPLCGPSAGEGMCMCMWRWKNHRLKLNCKTLALVFASLEVMECGFCLLSWFCCFCINLCYLFLFFKLFNYPTAKISFLQYQFSRLPIVVLQLYSCCCFIVVIFLVYLFCSFVLTKISSFG